MSGRPKLRVGWCDRAAAEFAVMHWHYSRSMPMPPAQYVGVWEDSAFVGAVIFAKGANHRVGAYFGVSTPQVAELVRVALRAHKTPVSRILRFAVRLIRERNPGLSVLVSYADQREGHHGGIYQASGWSYLGETASTTGYLVDGKLMHKRAFTGRNFGAPSATVPTNAELVRTEPKHRYALGLDDAMKAWLQARARPYPKRAASIDVDAPAYQAGEAGSLPSAALPEGP